MVNIESNSIILNETLDEFPRESSAGLGFPSAILEVTFEMVLESLVKFRFYRKYNCNWRFHESLVEFSRIRVKMDFFL